MIRLTKPDVGGALDQIKVILESGFLVQGRKVQEFEQAVAQYVGRKHGIAVNSGTSAIQSALTALGLGKGDEVLLPDFTFPASANAVVCAGATPVLVDIDPVTFNIDARSVEASLTVRSRAVMPVDLFGLPADLAAIADLCARHGLVMIEDSACALGASSGGRRCGSFGDAGAISFHPRKVVTTGEGGMVLTDDDDVAGSVRRLRNHGMEVTDGEVRFVSAGYNLRMNEIEACLGLAQMKRIDDAVAQRRRVASAYDRLLGEIDEVTAPSGCEGTFHTYQSYVVMVDDSVDRDRLIVLMKENGVETAIGTYSIHAQPFYRDMFGLEPGSIPSSYRAFRQSLSLPIYASMDEATVQRVAGTMKACIPRAAAGK
jgi:perosamine synthetase